MTSLERRMAEDLHWAGTAPEVQAYPGKPVIVRNKRVIGVGLDRSALLEEAVAQEGCHPNELIVEVVPPLDL